MKKVWSWVLLVLFFTSGGFLGAEPLALSLDEAIHRALDQSIDLQKNSLDLAAAGYAANHLWAEIFPGISAKAGLNYSTPLFTDPGFQAEKKNLTYSASLGLTLSMNAGLPQTMKLLELAYRTQLLSYENARRQLEIRVTKDFFALLTENTRIGHLEMMSELAERQREKSRISFENGLTGELTYLRSRLTAETARLDLNRARTNYTAQMGSFLTGLGLDQAGETALEGVLRIVPVEAEPESLIAEYLPKRPDIVGQRQTIERLERERSRTLLTTYSPSLSLDFSTQWGSNFDNFSGKPTDSLKGGVTINIPVDSFIPGTKAAQKLSADDRNIEKAQLDLKNTENNAMNQIRSLAANLRNSWSSVEISRLQVQIAERTYELTDQGFQQGAVEYLTLEETRNSMSNARQQLLSNELTYQNTILDMAAALNIDWKELMRSVP